MECMHPLDIPNPKYGLVIGAPKRLLVPCGKCAHCHANRVNEWAFRIHQEIKVSTSAWFVRLSYQDKCLPTKSGVPVLNYRDLRNFFNKLRENDERKHNIRYFAIGEYSPEPAYRPHYHIALFNLPTVGNSYNIYAKRLICAAWNFGSIDVRPINDFRVRYLAKYNLSRHELPEFYLQKGIKPAMRCSQHFGLNYLTDNVLQHCHRNLSTKVSLDGFPVSLPRYYKRKIFSDDEQRTITVRSKLYLQEQLEKGESITSSKENWDKAIQFEENYFNRNKKRSRYLTREENLI